MPASRLPSYSHLAPQNLTHADIVAMTSGAPQTTLTAVPRRRNGRPQACEPCHKRKVACDHRLPTCSRCKRGGITDRCVYVTKRPSMHTGTSMLPTPPKSGDLQSPTYQPPVLPPPKPPTSGAIEHEGGLGYLGATSFSAVLQEAEKSLTSMQGIMDNVEIENTEQREKCSRLLAQKPSGFALDILRSIPDRPTCDALFDSIHSPFDGWSRMAGRRLQDSLWETFGDILDGPRGEKALWSLASKLCLNTADLLKDEHTDPAKWYAEFSGKRFRWESLGILFNYWAIALLGDTSRFAKVGINLTDESKQAALMHYKNNAWNCSQLCWEACNGNSLMLFLLYQHSLIESNVSGDAEMKHWRLLGDVVAMTTYLGLHAFNKPANDASISTQINRKLFATVFTLDKSAATFSGRPPLLSGRFAQTSLPLDIPDEVLLAGPPSDAPRVDERGWNLDGKVYTVTILRARAMLAYTRDSILEVTLTGSTDPCEDLLNGLKRKEKEIYASFPPALIYKPADTRSMDNWDKVIFSAQLQLQVEHLQNLFFIERLLLKTPSGSMSELVRLGMEMVGLALIPWSNQRVLESPPSDVEWVVMCYGGPAAGILCLELLRPSEASQGPNAVSKSAIIQQLSKLVGILEWVTPVTPNTKLCANIRDVIQKVLDRVLDPPAQMTSPSQQTGWMMEMTSDMNVNEMFNFELFDTFDWLRPTDGVPSNVV